MIARLIQSHPYRLIEFLVLCITIPTLIIINVWAPFMFFFLWAVCLYTFLIHRATQRESLRHMWNWGAVTWHNMKPVLVRWVLASIAMALFLWWYNGERLFYLPQNSPQIIFALFFLYPVLSALPQEFIFCTFFFDRYKRYFGAGMGMVLASAIAFAYAHVLYINPVAPLLSFFGGLIFALTYMKHRSLALVTIEHGLYGNSLFIIGLGWYFYSGAVVGG